MLPMDCHTHTGISPDGSGMVAGHVEQAKKLWNWISQKGEDEQQ